MKPLGRNIIVGCYWILLLLLYKGRTHIHINLVIGGLFSCPSELEDSISIGAQVRAISFLFLDRLLRDVEEIFAFLGCWNVIIVSHILYIAHTFIEVTNVVVQLIIWVSRKSDGVKFADTDALSSNHGHILGGLEWCNAVHVIWWSKFGFRVELRHWEANRCPHVFYRRLIQNFILFGRLDDKDTASSRKLEGVLELKIVLIEILCLNLRLLLYNILLLHIFLLLRSQFHHTLKNSLLEAKVLHSHILHQFHLFLKKSVEILNQPTTWVIR